MNNIIQPNIPLQIEISPPKHYVVTTVKTPITKKIIKASSSITNSNVIAKEYISNSDIALFHEEATHK